MVIYHPTEGCYAMAGLKEDDDAFLRKMNEFYTVQKLCDVCDPIPGFAISLFYDAISSRPSTKSFRNWVVPSLAPHKTDLQIGFYPATLKKFPSLFQVSIISQVLIFFTCCQSW
ncbi:hypothetical protein K2173_025098 [Erythroxylum novogranatense]|uniref:Uncharacterized protein n=1 Tax=Erythroxylum novogranatense TaxID=1862640 RepID=A0AAV8SWB8_9ROSI|nr:hypothetical protein K2173_025098 [Erythroxylum novogranatense]